MDFELPAICPYDNDVIQGIKNVIKEQNITDLIIGVDAQKGFSPSSVFNIYNGHIHNTQINLLIYHAVQPISTVKKHLVFISKNAETQAGFFHALLRVWNLARNGGAVMEFYAFPDMVKVLKRIVKSVNIEAKIIQIRSEEHT